MEAKETRRRKKPLTDFGVDVKVFTARTGITAKALAELAGVNVNTMYEAMTGRSAGHDLIPIVRQYMAAYTAERS